MLIVSSRKTRPRYHPCLHACRYVRMSPAVCNIRIMKDNVDLEDFSSLAILRRILATPLVGTWKGYSAWVIRQTQTGPVLAKKLLGSNLTFDDGPERS